MTGPPAGRPPGREVGQPPLYETAPMDGTTSDASEGAGVDPGDSSVAETGTTIVGLAAEDSVVLAADRRASVGGGRFVTSKDVMKLEEVHPTAALAGSGAVGHLQQFADQLRAESSLYETRRGEPMSVDALATVAGNVLGSTPLRVVPLLGGVDESGPVVYQLDGGGGVLAETHAAAGSGMQLAYGVLEREYDDDMSLEAARAVAGRAIESASERDTASGNGLTVAVVDAEGIAVETHDDVGEVAA